MVCTHRSQLRAAIAARAAVDGHCLTLASSLCLSRSTRPFSFTRAATFGLTLGVVAQGAKVVKVRGARHRVDVDHLLVMTHEEEHETAVTEASAGRPFLGMAVTFAPDRIAGALLKLAEAGVPAPVATSTDDPPVFVLAADPAIATALGRLFEHLDDPVDRQVLLPLVLDEILLRLLRSDAAAAVRRAAHAENDAQRILATMRHIQDDLTRDFTVERLARRAGMSPSHFAHRFRAVARVSPMRYVREARLLRARALLLENGARANEVATRVGFASPSHFSREFKRRFGATPGKLVEALVHE